MSAATSFQLPDLLALTRSFELRTNPSCLPAARRCEAWAREHIPDQDLSLAEKKQLSGLKIGLLASLCFPGCDLPQLTLLASWMTTMLVCQQRLQVWVGREGIMGAAGKLEMASPGRDPTLIVGWLPEAGGEGKGGGEDPIEIRDQLANHALFRHVLPCFSQLTRIDADDASKSWAGRLGDAFRGYKSVQCRLLTSGIGQREHVSMEVKSFLELRRSAGGWETLWTLFEHLEDLHLEKLSPQLLVGFQRLKTLTTDILSWIFDIAAYNLDQFHQNPWNLIALLISQQRLSLHGAVSYAGEQVKTLLLQFIASEQSIFSPQASPSDLDPSHSTRSITDTCAAEGSISSHGGLGEKFTGWLRMLPVGGLFSPMHISASANTIGSAHAHVNATQWPAATGTEMILPPLPSPGSLSQSVRSSRLGDDDDADGEAARLEKLEQLRPAVQNLRDCVVGVVNWIYETELYFGAKGEEVRMFGWVFLVPPPPPGVR